MQARTLKGLRPPARQGQTQKQTPVLPDKLARKILLGNGERIWHLGLMSASFIVFFLILDYVRWQAGLFTLSPVYLWLFITHLAAVSSSVSAIIIFRRNEIFNRIKTSNIKRLQSIYLFLFFLPYIAKAMLSIIDRGSIMLYCLLLIVLNLVFIIRQSERIIFNLLLFLLFGATILFTHDGNTQLTAAKLTECLGCVITCFFMGQLQYRLVIKNMHQEMLFQEQMEEIALEKKRNNELMLNLLPKSAVLELKRNGYIQARTYEQSTVGVLELTNFREQSNKMSAVRLIRELNRYYTEFDRVLSHYGLERIRANSNAYTFTAGMPQEQDGAVAHVLHAAGQMLKYIQSEERLKKEYGSFTARIGIHSGPLSAGIVGNGRFSYEIWGDTLTLANEIKNKAHDQEILISESTHNLLLNCKVCSLHSIIKTPEGRDMQVYRFQF